MPRAINNVASKQRRKKVLKLAKGFRGKRKNTYRAAKNAVIKALSYAYRDRKAKKREFRQLWIARINAAARLYEISYSKLIHGLKVANVDIDRKMLADIAANHTAEFEKLVNIAKENL